MEEEVLLDMYRNVWDDFLEAYKEKMNQVDKLEEIARAFVQNSEDVEGAAALEKEINEIIGVGTDGGS